jgi:diguanylate cyclase (GGDEF)-like protein
MQTDKNRYSDYLLVYKPDSTSSEVDFGYIENQGIQIKFASEKKRMVDMMHVQEAAAVITFYNSEKNNEIDFLRYIMRQHPHTQRIYLTDTLNKSLVEKMINKAHINYLLQLPLDLSELYEIIKKAFKRYRYLNKPARRLSDLTDITTGLLGDIIKYRNEAGTDALTSLLNRRSFDQILEKGLMLFHEKNMAFTLIMIDLDDFKKLNDQFGHSAGDEVLRTFGSILQENMRLEDTAFRYGGEEFAIIASGDQSHNIMNFVNRISEEFKENKIHYNGKRLAITFSAGLAVMRKSFTKDDLINAADKALYRAKSLGKDRIVDYDAIDRS